MRFARTFVDTNTEHRFEKGKEWNELPYCVRCRGLEGSLLATCPVQTLTLLEQEVAYKAFLARGDHKSATIDEYNAHARLVNDKLLDAHLIAALLNLKS